MLPAAALTRRDWRLSPEMRRIDERFSHQAADTHLTPEQAFDRNWALGMCDGAISELRHLIAAISSGSSML